MKLERVPGQFAICRLDANAAIPTETPLLPGFLSITRTADEVSIVCDQNSAPESANVESGWRCFRIRGPIPFSETGVLVRLLIPLRDAEIGIFAISTFDTDYLLVKDETYEVAEQTLEAAGFRFED